MDYNMFGGPFTHGHGSGVSAVATVLAVVARFVFRKELLQQFNEREGLSVDLHWLWTLIFGGLYFQYRFNKINELKRATNRSLPAVS